jgi:putative addiction module killer protein
MTEIRETAVYKKWFLNLKDTRAKYRIDVRIKRLSLGNAGDVKSVGGGVSELRIDYGSGYRVYFKEQRNGGVILLCGGDKSTQQSDIAKAKKLVGEDENA